MTEQPQDAAPQQLFLAHAGDGVVATCELDADGTLTETARCEVGPGATALVLDRPRDRMFVSVRSDPPTVVTVRIDEAGRLTPVSRTEVADSLTYLSVDPSGHTLLAVSYGGGFGVSMPIAADGTVGAVASRVEHANLHSVIVSDDGRFAYLASLGEDVIAQCSLVGGRLEPLDPPTVAAPPKSGPRHLVLSADGRNLYCSTEFSGEAIRFTRDPETGLLTRAEAVSAIDESRGLMHSELGADPVEGHLIWGADLHLSPDERFLFVSERCESTLVGIAVAEDGALQGQVSITETVRQPRGFGITPDGHLIAVGEKSDEVVAYAIEADGSLTVTSRIRGGRKSNWVAI
ncbi:6-phosphogluconolactonase [Enemella dayhoffiae]|uniref:6-phosphogluconolactonase n=1 Tax=Enemella dayhoffiae TaxID=2016507 RepID=A0A255H7C1_9ACTN|nr:beta-propeller fold lactonase family protein [Enemella dayhoffiae]OYO23447.1 6-phosphogluconolactonase [Enemella dayhoffiae]